MEYKNVFEENSVLCSSNRFFRFLFRLFDGNIDSKTTSLVNELMYYAQPSEARVIPVGPVNLFG